MGLTSPEAILRHENRCVPWDICPVDSKALRGRISEPSGWNCGMKTQCLIDDGIKVTFCSELL